MAGLALYVLTLTVYLHAQQPKPPAYDVVTIKPNTHSRGVSVRVNDNIYKAINVSLKDMLEQAYGIWDYLISGAPGWAESTRFDIEAKVVESDRHTLNSLGRREREALLQPVLADRFQVKVHTETRVLPIYELTIANPKAELKFQESSPAEKDKQWHEVSAGSIRVHDGHLIAHQVELSRLIDVIAREMHRTVLDRTDLKGQYDLLLDFTPADAPPSPDAAAPGLPTALQEQLGLKLESGKGPVETLVVDNAELPTED